MIKQHWNLIGREPFLSLTWELDKRNCHNSRTSDDIDMNLGPVTKLDKGNETMSKNFDDDAIS